MKKIRKSFLEENQQERKFNAFNVINIMLAVGVFSMFVIAVGFCIRDMIIATDKSKFIIPLIERIIATLLVFLPLLITKLFKISFPKLTTTIYYLMLFLSLYLGTFIGLYSKTTYWDIIVHLLSGVCFGFFAMFFIKIANDKRNENLNPYLVFILVFVFSMAIGGCWEIYEFTFDSLLGLNMQGFKLNGTSLVGQKALLDTMLDLIADLVGAVISALICAICSYKCNSFISKFKITKINNEKKENISQIEE